MQQVLRPAPDADPGTGIEPASDVRPGRLPKPVSPQPVRCHPRTVTRRIISRNRGPGSTHPRRPARTGSDPSETADHSRNTTSPQWTETKKRLIYVSAAQPPLDPARPKGLEPLTF